MKKVKELRDTHINPSFAKTVLLKEDIDLAANLLNNTKFQLLDSPYYTSDKLIHFSAEFSKDCFSIFLSNRYVKYEQKFWKLERP